MTTLIRRAALAVALGATLGLGSPAAAQTVGQKATAQQAFDNAVVMMEAGENERACPLLEESLALDPAMGTKYQLAQCYEKIGRLVSAWASYIEVADAAQAANMQDREAWARERAEALKPRLSTLTITVPEQVATLPGFEVTRNGAPVGRGLWGLPLPVDGGSQRVSATATGKSPWSVELDVPPEGGKLTVEIPPLVEVSVAPPIAARYEPRAAAEPTGPSPLVYVGFGVAGAGLVLGTVTGIVSLSRTSSLQDECPNDLCRPEKQDDIDAARRIGHVSTASFVVAGLGAAVGLLAWLDDDDEAAAPSATEPAASALSVQPVLGVGLAGLKGTF